MTMNDNSTAGPKAAAGQKLVPVADPKTAGPVTLEASGFRGVTPGTSTVDDMQKAWGQPKDMRRDGKTTSYLYLVKPFSRVEANTRAARCCRW